MYQHSLYYSSGGKPNIALLSGGSITARQSPLPQHWSTLLHQSSFRLQQTICRKLHKAAVEKGRECAVEIVVVMSVWRLVVVFVRADPPPVSRPAPRHQCRHSQALHELNFQLPHWSSVLACVASCLTLAKLGWFGARVG